MLFSKTRIFSRSKGLAHSAMLITHLSTPLPVPYRHESKHDLKLSQGTYTLYG
jgi:hypothetical protein